MKFSYFGPLAHLVLVGLVLIHSGQAIANPFESTEPAVIETVLVTSQKREQNVQDIPVAISVIGDTEIERRSITDLIDLSSQLSSLDTTQQVSEFATTFSIRGLGTSGLNAGLEPSVGVFIDDIYQSRPANVIGDLLDVRRVEVLYGPQSTLFGKNTAAGVVSVVTRGPEKEPRYELGLGAGSYEQKIIQATATGPITDELFYRLSASHHQRDGYYENTYDGSELNDRDRWAVRGQLLFEPGDDLSLRFIGSYDSVDELCCAAPFYENQPYNAAVIDALGGSAINADPYSRKVAINDQNRYQHDQMQLSLTANWSGETIDVTSISAYQRFDMTADVDLDFTDLGITGVPTRNEDDNTAFSQELRINSAANQSLSWLGGLYYSYQDFDLDQSSVFGQDARAFFDVLTTSLAGGTPLVGPSPLTILEQAVLGLPADTFFANGQGVQAAAYDMSSESIALYGQIDWQVTDRLTLGGGLRWTYEEKKLDAQYTINDTFSALDLSPGGDIAAISPLFTLLSPLQFYPPADNQNEERSEADLSGHINIGYQWHDYANVYSSLRRGYKSGGFQVSSSIPVNGLEFDEETVDLVEVGLKLESPGRNWRFNSAVFYQQVDDYQVFVYDGTTTEVSNASDVEISGIEFEGGAQLTGQLYVDVNATYLDAEFKNFNNGPCPMAAGAQYCDLSGRPLPGIPDWTASTSLTYLMTIDQLRIYSWLQYSYKGDRYTAPDLDPVSHQDSVSIINASVTVLGSTEAWQLIFWGKNITDEEYTDSMFDSNGLPGNHNGYPGDPRTYGMTIKLVH